MQVIALSMNKTMDARRTQVSILRGTEDIIYTRVLGVIPIKTISSSRLYLNKMIKETSHQGINLSIYNRGCNRL